MSRLPESLPLLYSISLFHLEILFSYLLEFTTTREFSSHIPTMDFKGFDGRSFAAQ